MSKIQETMVALDMSVPSKTGGLAGLAVDITGSDLGSGVTGRLGERVLYSDVSESRSWYWSGAWSGSWFGSWSTLTVRGWGMTWKVPQSKLNWTSGPLLVCLVSGILSGRY